MKLRSKKLTTLLCVACLLGSQFGGSTVFANEIDDAVTVITDETTASEETTNEEITNEEATVVETTVAETENAQEETTTVEETAEETTQEDETIVVEETTEEITEETATEEEMTEEMALFSLERTAEEDYVDKLPTNLRWAKRESDYVSDNDTVYATFKVNSSEKYYYHIYLFKDGENIPNTHMLNSLEEYSGADYQAYVDSVLIEPGKYTFRIGMFTGYSDDGVYFSDYNSVKDNEKYNKYLTDFSDEYEIKSGLPKLASPVNVKHSKGITTWDVVPNAKGYVYRWKKAQDEDSALSGNSMTTFPILKLSWLKVGEEYEFHISAVPSDVEKYATSDETVFTFTMEAIEEVPDYDMTTHKYQVPTELTWVKDDFGRFSFKVNDNFPGYYYIRFYCNNENGTNMRSTWWMNDLSSYAGGNWTNEDRRSLGYGNGEYWFNVMVLGLTSTDFNKYMNEYGTIEKVIENENINYVISEDSPKLVQNVDKKLDYVKDIKWDKDKYGTVSWSPVENAGFYSATLYKEVKENGYGTYLKTIETRDTSVNFATYMTDSNESYGVRVNAMSGDTQHYLHGWSTDLIPMNGISTDTTIEEAKDNLKDIDNLNQESSAEDVKAVVDTVKDTYSDSVSNLQSAMQNDDEVLSKIDNLEKLYAEKNNVTTTSNVKEDEVGFTSSDVSIIGAGLNAEPNTSITFNVEKAKPENNILFSENKYANAVQFNLDMTVGETKIQNLDIPVTITIPIPAGVNPDKLVILHQTPNASLGYELIHPKISADKKKATFTVTHFSTFAFAEEVPVVENNTKPSGDSQSSPSSDVVSTVKKSEKIFIGNTVGWDGMEKEVKDVIDKFTSGKLSAPVLNISVYGKAVIPEKAVKAIAGKDIIVSVKLKDGIIVNIDGKAIDENFSGTISLSTTEEKNGSIKVHVRNSVTDVTKAIAVFAKANPGMVEAGLYFVDADGTLIPFGQSPVFENGYVAFVTPFVSADYIIK